MIHADADSMGHLPISFWSGNPLCGMLDRPFLSTSLEGMCFWVHSRTCPPVDGDDDMHKSCSQGQVRIESLVHQISASLISTTLGLARVWKEKPVPVCQFSARRLVVIRGGGRPKSRGLVDPHNVAHDVHLVSLTCRAWLAFPWPLRPPRKTTRPAERRSLVVPRTETGSHYSGLVR